MKKIALVTRNEKHCGIYGYSKSAISILQHSTRYQYELVPCDLPNDRNDPMNCARWLDSIEADAIMFNWCPYTMFWLTDEVLHAVKPERPYFVISGHDYLFNARNPLRGPPQHIWNVDPDYGKRHIRLAVEYSCLDNSGTYLSSQLDVPRIGGLPRPVVRYSDITYSPPDTTQPLKIGTFGFSGISKGYDIMFDYLDRDFPDTPIEVHLQLSRGQWDGYDPEPGDKLAEACRARAGQNMKVIVNHDFIEDPYDLVKWLNNLDLIMFTYWPLRERVAVSSCIDFALAAQKPIAVNDSKMFSHIAGERSIFLEQNSMQDIVKRGIEPLQQFYNEWSYAAFIEEVESRITKFI